MQYGFVIDHSRCIGCHACTVACKSENDVPLGDFRTWVKYTEAGSFPEVRRSFAVLRCNQCTDAPCVTICPVVALDKRDDGIVDIDPERCIGCKSCMQACPYDALYINEEEGVAEKCHFCAHRVERGLAPACAVVCPTEAIIPGDFHDPVSRVAQMKATGELTARKTEAKTGPNVWYREVSPDGVEPLATNHAGGYLWANQQPGLSQEVQAFEAAESKARARTVYDVAHAPRWGGKLTGYLFLKSIAAGVFLAGIPFLGMARGAIALIGLVALTLTTALLVLDLKRSERFLYILRYGNWDSWLVRGTWILIGYGGLLTLWFLPLPLPYWPSVLLTALFAAGSACYTAWLFGQAKGRPLWMQRGLSLELLAHAVVAGAALIALIIALTYNVVSSTALTILLVALGVQVLLTFAKPRLAPRGREQEYARTLALIERGPFAGLHRFALIGGTIVPSLAIALVLVLTTDPGNTTALVATGGAAVLSLVGLWLHQDITIRAGQALPIS